MVFATGSPWAVAKARMKPSRPDLTARIPLRSRAPAEGSVEFKIECALLNSAVDVPARSPSRKTASEDFPPPCGPVIENVRPAAGSAKPLAIREMTSSARPVGTYPAIALRPWSRSTLADLLNRFLVATKSANTVVTLRHPAIPFESARGAACALLARDRHQISRASSLDFQ
jgi:hypothetical protein